jgi:hypothetical protein
MENDSDANIVKYILESKKNIDIYIIRNDFKKAFGLLILVLERINDDEKKELIDYYNKNMFKFGILRDSFFK